jgi:glyoxylase-like metal-dependent hydrolase (beta-lactamase superfamily II)
MNGFVSRIIAAAVAACASVAVAGPPAPTPDRAAAAAAPIIAQPFKDVGLWYGQFGGTLCSWLEAGDGVFLIDTGSTAADAKSLKAEIARTTKGKPVKWIALTHLHADSNDGLTAFLPTDATIFVNARATGALAVSIAQGKSKAPQVIGISDRIALVAGKQVFEIGAPAGNAHTAFDLYVFDVSTRTVFTGDLVTPERCPMLSDPDSDLKGWIAALDRLDTLGAQGLVPTRGNPAPAAAPEIEKTRRYLTSLLGFLTEKKKQNAPEARVTGELAAEKLADYCPRELSALNALSVYRRLQSDGTTRPGSADGKPASK